MSMDLSLAPSTIVTILITLVISLSVHEATHAYTSLKLGDATAFEHGRVSFNPLRHIDPVATILLPVITLILFHVPFLAAKPVPFNPNRLKYDEFGAALVAAAGPLSNLAMAVLGALLTHLAGNNITILNILSVFVSVNVAIFVFNLIPIPPLDGSRVLYAFAPEGLQRIMAQIEPFGFFVVFGLVLAVPGFSSLLFFMNDAVLRLLPIVRV